MAFHDVKSLRLPSSREASTLDTAGLRSTFLLEDLFRPGEIRLALTDMDRLAVGAAMPRQTPLELDPSFTERREAGVVNVGEPGHVTVGGERYSVGAFDFLYIGKDHPEVRFASCDGSSPAFYFLSCPAHRPMAARLIRRSEAQVETIGSANDATLRRLHKYIHPGGAASCQLVMGMTEMQPGSVWNTMPPHTHPRRSEVYLYCGLPDGVVVHLLGEPEQTRHVIVRDREAVLSPSWSVHCGAGTRPYSFIWGMAGENQEFSDIDPIDVSQLR